MADEKHEHGKMNIEAQEAAFDGFMRWVVRCAVVSIAVLVFLAIFRT